MATYNRFVLNGSNSSLTYNNVFTNTSTTLSLNGGATLSSNGIALDGVDDYITIPKSILDFGSNDFTISLWAENKNTPENAEGNVIFDIGGYYDAPSFIIYLQGNSNALKFYSTSNDTDGTNFTYRFSQTTKFEVDGNIHHIFLTRHNNLIKLFVDGINAFSTIDYTGKTFADVDYRIGYYLGGNNSRYTKMDVHRLDIWKGTGFQDFTSYNNYLQLNPRNTFILSGSNKSLTDINTSQVLTLNGGTQLSNTNGVSLDGIDDYITIPKSILDFGSDDFTISLWAEYKNTPALSGGNTIFDIGGYPAASAFIIYLQPDTNDLKFYSTSNDTDGTDFTYRFSQTTNFEQDGNIHHIILTRYNNLIKLFVDGVDAFTTIDYRGKSFANVDYRIGYTSSGNNRYTKMDVHRLDVWKGFGFSNINTIYSQEFFNNVNSFISDISVDVLRNTQQNIIYFIPSHIFTSMSGTKEFKIVESSKNYDAGYEIQNNICYYSPKDNFSGSDSFQYYIIYNGVTSHTKTVTINIKGITVNSRNTGEHSYITRDERSNTVLKFNKEVESIDNHAFFNTNYFNVVQFDYKIRSIGTSAFRSSRVREIIFKDDIDIIHDSAFYFCNIERIEYNNQYYFINNTTLSIPNGVTEIGGVLRGHHHFYSENNNNVLLPNSAFNYLNLTELLLPMSLTTIRQGALRYSKIESLVLPNNVSFVGYYAFYGNEVKNLFVTTNLKEILYGSFNKYTLQNYFVYNVDTSIIYLGDKEEHAGENDYDPLIIATSQSFKLTDILGYIMPRNIFMYPGYISSKTITLSATEDIQEIFNLRQYTEENIGTSTINILEVTRGNFVFNDPNIIFTSELNSNIDDGFIYEEQLSNDDVELVTAKILINPVNDPPVSNSMTINVNEDETIIIDLSHNDIDNITTELSYNIITKPHIGTLTSIENSKMSILYRTYPNFNGDVSFTFSISDLQFESNISTVNISVLAVNDPPIVYDLTETIYENTLGFNRTLTFNDIDTSSSLITYHIYEQPSHGTANIVNSNVNYIPNFDYYGNDSFKYYAMDGDLSSNVATFQVTILEEIIPPVAFDSKFEMLENSILNIKINSEYLQGDVNDLSFIIVNNMKYGSFTRISHHNYEYKPDLYYTGFDSLSYYLLAPNGSQSTNSSISIHILKDVYANCKYCPPKVIFERNSNTYFNKSGRTHSAYKNMRNQGGGKLNIISQKQEIIVPPRNKF